ncbi:MAG: hypothetical protein GC131_05565 [Alphaproteobacteria bacterium]|nr:hypothetical protein [Alphaproteobacteria bacterium]
MNAFLQHPVTGALLFCALSLWPLMRIFRRVGLRPAWGLLIFANLLLPFLGIVLVAGTLGHRAWPRIPKIPRPAKPNKKDWSAA